ncbi:MAG: hypothetical protein KF749_03335 [Bacteroidetes bacterium]|nr:hypothetical protein [Bacteroidota bacterium]MCW5895524.1 hypothetical protein [Bacteroidota bacterium]
MIEFLFVISFLINFVAISIAMPTIVDTYQRYSRGKLVICPEKKQQATVAVSPRIAAVSSVLIPKEIRIVKACSLWPEMDCCHRACTAQIR